LEIIGLPYLGPRTPPTSFSYFGNFCRTIFSKKKCTSRSIVVRELGGSFEMGGNNRTSSNLIYAKPHQSINSTQKLNTSNNKILRKINYQKIVNSITLSSKFSYIKSSSSIKESIRAVSIYNNNISSDQHGKL
jgi:hypothetical protein